MAVYVTGDTHGDFRQIGDFCSVMVTKRDDVMIVLGDAGLNYFGDVRDTARKTGVSRTRMTYLMIHGNHEMRPETLNGYRLIPWNGGMVYQEEPFPNLLFAKDGKFTGLAGRMCWSSAGPTAWTRNTGCGWGIAGFRTNSLPMRLRSMWNNNWIKPAGRWMRYCPIPAPANTSRWSISCRGLTSPRWISLRKTGLTRSRTGWIIRNGTAGTGISTRRLIS